MIYRAWYVKDANFRDFIFGDKLPDMADIEATHTFLREVEADSLDGVYHDSQGEIWSPEGEARDLIRPGMAELGIQVVFLYGRPDGFHPAWPTRAGTARR